MNFLFSLLLIFIFWDILTIKNIIFLSLFYFCYLSLLSLNGNNYRSSVYQPRSFSPTEVNESDDNNY
jgi:hypothetical protein